MKRNVTLILTGLTVIVVGFFLISGCSKGTSPTPIPTTSTTSTTVSTTSTSTTTSTIPLWEVKTPMPTPRAAAAAGVLNNKFYVVGGITAMGSTATFSPILEIYDPATDQWSTGASMLETPSFVLSATANGKLYVLNTAGNGTFEAYDPVSDSWSYLPYNPLREGTLATVNNIIYVMGGNHNGHDLTTNEAFNPATGSVTTKTDLAMGGTYFGVAVDGTNIYLIGGSSHLLGINNVVQRYNTISNSWSILAPLNFERVVPSVAVVGRKIYAFNGVDNNFTPVITPEVYDIDQNTWTPLETYPLVLITFPAPQINNRIYLIGGIDMNLLSLSGTVEVYTPR